MQSSKLSPRKTTTLLAAVLIAGAPSLLPASEVENPVGMEMIHIPATEFTMGYCQMSNQQIHQNRTKQFLGKETEDFDCHPEDNYYENAIPARPVKLSGFYVSKEPVTLGQFKTYLRDIGEEAHLTPFFLNANESKDENEHITAVTPMGAEDFSNWMDNHSPGRWSVISEAQWEYLCTQGEQEDFCSNEALTIGLNKEITADCWHKNYNGAPSSGEPWVNECDDYRPGAETAAQVVRGGDLLARERGYQRVVYMSRDTTFRLVMKEAP